MTRFPAGTATECQAARGDRQSLPLLAGTPRVRVRPRELTGEVAARCERGGPFCIYFLHCHELRTGNSPKRIATTVRPNPLLNPTRNSGLRPLPQQIPVSGN